MHSKRNEPFFSNLLAGAINEKNTKENEEGGGEMEKRRERTNDLPFSICRCLFPN